MELLKQLSDNLIKPKMKMHTNWQWFPVIKESHPLVLDNFAKDYRPIVQVIDNIERNHKLGLVMEWKVGAGKLLVCKRLRVYTLHNSKKQ